jgi:hypothetical protein
LLCLLSFLNSMEFPNENIAENKKPPTEYELLGMLERGEVKLPPVQLTLHQDVVRVPQHQIDGCLKAQWGGLDAVFVFEYKATNTPRVQETAIAQVNLYAHQLGLLPLVVLPYLSEVALAELDRSETSGIDLCGNGLLIAKNFRFWRSGQPNRYKDTRPIRNPFHGDSSIFARCFLLRDHFSSLLDLGKFAQDRTFDAYPAFRQKALTQGTASKVVQSLVDELTVRKVDSGLELQDRRRLLTLLRRGYRRTEPPKVIGSSLLSPEDIWYAVQEERIHGGSFRAVATGLSSAGYYKALSGSGRLGLYVSNLNAATTRLQIRTGKAFANIELHEDRKNTVYFDAREDGGKLWASPIQTWLELAAGGPREQEAAEQIERTLLNQETNN